LNYARVFRHLRLFSIFAWQGFGRKIVRSPAGTSSAEKRRGEAEKIAAAGLQSIARPAAAPCGLGEL